MLFIICGLEDCVNIDVIKNLGAELILVISNSFSYKIWYEIELERKLQAVERVKKTGEATTSVWLLGETT